MSKSNLRKEELLSLLSQNGKLTAEQIAERFHISMPTVRRVCKDLADEGRVLRIRGGIHYLPEQKAQYSFQQKAQEYNEEKVRIAKYASSLVEDGQMIFLEAGTTVGEMAVQLLSRIKKGELHDLMVFTNSLVILEILDPTCQVTMIGGQYRTERKDFVGLMSERMLRSLSFDQCFIGVDAISLSDGIMAMDGETVRLDTLLVSRARRASVLVNSAKFNQLSLISFASVHDIDMVITDTDLSENIANDFRNAGVNLVCV